MKLTSKIKKKMTRIFFLCLFILVFLFQSDPKLTKALSMDTFKSALVTEELRIKVPSKFKEVWLKTEKKIWEPWLSTQDGFLGRQLFWDKEKEEALILVSWKSKKLWKSIPMSEVNLVQENFEENVKTALDLNENPFKLIYEGELDNQL